MSQLFEEVDAKLSHDFNASTGEGADKLALLLELSTDLPVTLLLSDDDHNPQPLIVRGAFSFLLLMQKRFSLQLSHLTDNETQTDHLLFVEQNVDAKEAVKSTTVDTGVECKIIEAPLFTKYGRQVRTRYSDVYTTVDSIDTDEVIIEPTPETKTTLHHKPAHRKRGRPPKSKSNNVQTIEDVAVKLEETKSPSSLDANPKTLDQLDEICEPTNSKVNSELDSKNLLSENEPGSQDKQQTRAELTQTTTNEQRKSRIDILRQQKLEYEKRTPCKFKCDLCCFETKRESHLKRHQGYHNVKKCKVHECRECSYKTIRLAMLTKHQLIHNEKLSELFCTVCSYSCMAEQTLSNHYKAKHDDDSAGYSRFCDKCDYYTHSAQLYRRHMKSHTVGEITTETFSCKLCSYKTDKKALFTQHSTTTHSDARPFICDLCGTAFKRKHGMLQHKVYMHQDRKTSMKFKCIKCDKLFRSLAHLKEHNMRHSSERKFLCHACGSKFKTKSSQKRHYEVVHRNKRAYVCRKCNKSFHVRATLVRHQRLECKRKPRKDAFGLMQQNLMVSSSEQEIKLQPLSFVSTFQLNQDNVVELHRIDDNSFIELQESVLVQEGPIVEQSTSVLSENFTTITQNTSFLQDKMSEISERTQETNTLTLNSDLAQQLIYSNNTSAMINNDSGQQTVFAILSDGSQVQYLDNSTIEEVQISDGVTGLNDIQDLCILPEETIAQDGITELDSMGKQPVYITYVT